MSTLITPELSRKNPYYISRHRFYELRHFCLQYDEWKDTLGTLNLYNSDEYTKDYKDPTCNAAVIREECMKNMALIEKIALEADESLSKYIFKSVTEDVSYTYLRNYMNMPAGKDMFYDRYRRFYWLLDKYR